MRLSSYLIVSIATLVVTGFSGAQEPVAARAITAAKKITGDGTRQTPFVFSTGSLGKLSIDGMADWTLDDCPIESEILDTSLLFPTDSPGVYHVIAVVDGKAAHAWFEIKGPNGPPVPPKPVSISEQIAACFTGPDAVKDAKRFAVIVGAVKDSLSKCRDTADVFDAWETAFIAAQWNATKYTRLKPIYYQTLPQQGTNETLTPELMKSIESTLQQFIDGANSVE